MNGSAAESGGGRWEAQIRKGCLELAILATLWKSRLYGLEILRALGGRPAVGLAEGTLYLILGRLHAEELVESEWVDAGSGHPRKYYRLTELGRERLRHMARFWRQFSADLDDLVEPVLGRREVASVRR